MTEIKYNPYIGKKNNNKWNLPLTDFTEYDSKADIKIVTRDRVTVYFYSSKLEVYPYFDNLINKQVVSLIEGLNPKKGYYKHKIIYIPAKSRETNLLLNYIYMNHTDIFGLRELTYCDYKALCRLARTVGIGVLEVLCCIHIGRLGIVDKNMIDIYNRYKIDKTELIQGINKGDLTLHHTVSLSDIVR